ncbi:MAG: hypothetical protein P4N60_21325 [Verrucomicrobiae bacterium]|nr:hypothetical protein [Verrucomicrobiae bacterium]
MSTIRNGKIARLPQAVREELNRRLADHESGTSLLNWLNGLPAVRAVLVSEFGGRAVNGYNLHEWRHGGHAEWRQERAARNIMQDLRKDSHQFSEAAGGSVTDTLADWLAARYVVGMKKQLDRDGDPAADWERMREFCQDVVALRRGEYRAQRLELVRAGLALRSKQMECEPPGPPKDERGEGSKGEHLTSKENPQPSESHGSAGGARLAAGPAGRPPLATGKSPEPAGWKTCPAPENESERQTG